MLFQEMTGTSVGGGGGTEARAEQEAAGCSGACEMLLLAQVNYGPRICCEPVRNAQKSLQHANDAVALCDCVTWGEKADTHICLIHVYVCTDMHVCLPTPPTSKPQMPEGQTSRRSASLLGVPVAGTALSEEGSGAAPPNELILTPISVTFKGLSH